MNELSNERIEQILHEETAKKEELTTLLRGIYTRYMRLYERYFEDIDALNSDKIAELKEFHKETRSLFKYYYMDIPLDICAEIEEFDDKYTAKLLGSDWRKILFGSYREFKEYSGSKNNKNLKAEFSKQTLSAFYDSMNYIFREGFGTDSQKRKDLMGGIAELLFGKQQ
ncbi:MAG: hypothetical protein II971_00945 [Firmicutes bacterium]|nr:hypothetical protein [Bacillota bacterium]